ncbi:MAG: DUF4173 domain-containing protein [Clostridiales bacterium]|nr:DUF4173 domain-containing protein [Clostridiales bacterium]
MNEQQTEVQSQNNQYAILFFIAFSIISWFAITCLWESFWGLRIFLVFAAFDGMSLLHAKTNGIAPPKRSYAYMGVSLGLILSLTFFENKLLVMPILMTAAAITLYWVPMAFSKCHRSVLEPSAISDAARTVILVPLMHLKETFSQLISAFKGHSFARRFLLGIIASIPLLVIAIGLLQEVDSQFLEVTRDIEKLLEQLFDFVPKFVLSLLLGFYLLSMVQGTAASEAAQPIKQRSSVDTVIGSVVVILLCGVYLLFIITQTRTVIDAFSATKMPAYFYSSFARRGFAELCWVALLNFGVAAVIQRRGTSKPIITKLLMSFLALSTICLIALAFSKMALYISIYGYTLKRIYTSCFMFVLAIVFLLLIIAQWRDLPLFKLSAILLAMSLLVLSYSNMSSFVAKSHMDDYLCAKSENIPTSTMREFPWATAPVYISAFDQVEDPSAQKAILTELAWINTLDDDESAPSIFTQSLQAVHGFASTEDFLVTHAAQAE